MKTRCFWVKIQPLPPLLLMLCFLGFYGDMFSLYLDKIHGAGTKHTSCGNTILKSLWCKKSVRICIHEQQQHKRID